MKYLVKTVSFIALVSAVPLAFAASSRNSMISSNAASRFPSISGSMNSKIVSIAGITGVVGKTTATSLMNNKECIDAYTSCIKGNDACGPNFEECTTNLLFHGQMPKCISILSQCTSSGINDLFGTSSVSNLSNIKEYNGYNEVSAYTYPTDGSVMGQLIIGAEISNRYSLQECLKKTKSCLKKDSVCGENFELCTDDTEFKQQSLLCSSTLARCQPDALMELYGHTNVYNPPLSTSQLGKMISDGRENAAVNAVDTCYKVANQCILSACGTNPAKCIGDLPAAKALALITDAMNDGTDIPDDVWRASLNMDTATDQDIKKYIRNMCQETIGSNKYCYMTTHDGKVPTAKELMEDPEFVFEEIYHDRMNSAMKQQLETILEKFDKKAKEKCVETFKTCAMRSCGGGSGAVCYTQTFLDGDKKVKTDASINTNETSREEIKLGCASAVSVDANCKYAVASNANSVYTYAYTDNTTFDTLFPDTEGSDPIGVVAKLNDLLTSSYNMTAIENMERQCKNIAINCIESSCGDDFQYCYRTRTDITLSNNSKGAYNTGNTSFDKSMNRQFGVLDYNIAIGLCIDTVEKAKVCEEHLKIQKAKAQADDNSVAGWGSGTSVRESWGGATSGVKIESCVVDVNKYQQDCEKGTATNTTCKCAKKVYNVRECGTSDDDGCMYTVSSNNEENLYKLAAQGVLNEALENVDLKAQAQYKARVQREQNVCYANNQGGIKGTNDIGSAFRWVKMNGIKLNAEKLSYEMDGLNEEQIANSNDLYGSFCAARVTLKIDDPKLQEKMENDSNIKNELNAYRYFAVGDSFVCGSWIKQSTLEKITDEIKDTKGITKWSTKEKGMLALGSILGAGAGGFGGGLLGEYAATGKVFGSSKTDKISKSDTDTYSGKCMEQAEKCAEGDKWTEVSSNCTGAVTAANHLDDKDVKEAKKELDNANKAAKAAGDADKKAETFSDVKVKAEKLYDACSSYVGKGAKYGNGIKKRDLGIGLGATLGGLAGGGAGFGIAYAAIQAKHENAANKEAQEWLDNIGQHIRCFVGTQYVGSYGDTVGLTLDDSNY